ncbi:MAG TPA: hypothetical protein VNK45_04905, partial [Candidatus Acidoferrales bacterium]|nr:hypothetical protein [Candidatus Acidoferrales bacterium]
KVVKAWLAANAHEIEVFYLPPYGPQLDADLKAVVSSKAPARAKGDLKKATISHLSKLQKSPKRLMRYFQHHPIQHAARTKFIRFGAIISFCPDRVQVR